MPCNPVLPTRGQTDVCVETDDFCNCAYCSYTTICTNIGYYPMEFLSSCYNDFVNYFKRLENDYSQVMYTQINKLIQAQQLQNLYYW